MVRKFLSHVLPGVIKPLHILWNEIIGFLFVVLAGLAVPSLLRNIRSFAGSAEDFFRVLLPVAFVLVMVGFGIGSFRRARKISRS